MVALLYKLYPVFSISIFSGLEEEGYRHTADVIPLGKKLVGKPRM
jgi:hypothetical protein